MASLRYAQLEIDLPDGWEGRGFSRQEETSGERTYAILHLANFALPTGVEDYGGGAVEGMRSRDVFVSLLEFGPESLGTPLFSTRGLPTLTRDSFDPNLLQRGIPGQSGAQEFFTLDGRPYCLYVVLGEHLLRFRVIPAINAILGGLRFDAT
jgi:hypothetical protein